MVDASAFWVPILQHRFGGPAAGLEFELQAVLGLRQLPQEQPHTSLAVDVSRVGNLNRDCNSTLYLIPKPVAAGCCHRHEIQQEHHSKKYGFSVDGLKSSLVLELCHLLAGLLTFPHVPY